MKKMPRIPVMEINDGDFKKLKDMNIRRCRIVWASFPAATKLYIAIKTSTTVKFVTDNWKEITNN